MTTSSSLPAEVIWPLSELHEAVPLLAGKAALLPADHPADLPPLPKDEATMEILTSWLESAARQLGLEARAAETVYPDLKDFLIQGAPALLPLPENTGSPGSFVLLAASRRRALRLLGRDGRLHRLPVNRVRDILVSDLEAPVLPVVESMLEQVNIREQQRGKVRKALLLEYLATTRVDGCWLLRLPPSTSFFRQLRRAKFPRRLSGLVGATLAARLLILGASFLVGKTIFQGNADLSDFQLWGLLLFTALPLQLTSMQVKNRLSIHFGILLRSRLLHGILQLRPEEIQHQGSGYFIGNVQEIEQLEAMGMSTAFMTLTAFLEVFIAAVVLMLGAGGIMHGALLLGWTGGILLLSRIYYRRMRDWLIHSRMMTCDLVERMVGHRTRLAQEKPEHMHVREDQLLSRYARLSERLDNMEVIMKSAAGRRGWLPVSLLGTLTLFFSTGAGVTQLAVSLGGTLLAALALDQLVQSIYQFLKTLMSWQQVLPLYQAAGRERAKKTPRFVSPTYFKQHGAKHPIIQAHELSFAYATSGAKKRIILDRCDLTVRPGQHVLLEGASGCGKSTLAALLSGLRRPDAGSLSLFGLPLTTLGEDAWRKRVVIAPQFHQNYVLTETFAFNLLMGRGWPPAQEDLIEAEAVCRELNLGELLESMPSGLQQMVGEGGWRLSHGERSRLFIARTLLQKADLIILDESFAALDPETLNIALACVLRRAAALLLIAHP